MQRSSDSEEQVEEAVKSASPSAPRSVQYFSADKPPSIPPPETNEARAARLIGQIDQLKRDALAVGRRYLIVMEIRKQDYERLSREEGVATRIDPIFLRGAAAPVYQYCITEREEKACFGFFVVFDEPRVKAMYMLLLEW